MTLFFYIVIAIITFFAFLHAWAKKSYDVNRTVFINKKKEEVYNYIRQLKNQPKWMPWFTKDPEAILKTKGEDGKIGAAFYWNGNNWVGEGTQKITKIKHNKVFETKILYIKPIKLTALTYIAVKEIEPDRTKMIWGVRGYLAFPLTIISLFYSPEKMLGIKLEEGLKDLKKILESK